MSNDNKPKQNKKTSIYFIIAGIILIIAIVTGIFWMNSKKDKEEKTISYTDLIKQIDDGVIEKVEMTVGSTSIKVKIKDVEEEKEAIKENEKERNKMWRDREIEFHKSIPILKKYTQEEMNSVMFNYIWEHFPLLQKGFDRKIYPKARDSFFGHIGIAYYRYQLPQKVQDKINIADDYVKNEIINRFKKLEIESIDKWAIQYKQSMDELGVKKYTKSSIKGFFDELGLKVSSIVIDTIKSKL